MDGIIGAACIVSVLAPVCVHDTEERETREGASPATCNMTIEQYRVYRVYITTCCIYTYIHVLRTAVFDILLLYIYPYYVSEKHLLRSSSGAAVICNTAAVVIDTVIA